MLRNIVLEKAKIDKTHLMVSRERKVENTIVDIKGKKLEMVLPIS